MDGLCDDAVANRSHGWSKSLMHVAEAGGPNAASSDRNSPTCRHRLGRIGLIVSVDLRLDHLSSAGLSTSAVIHAPAAQLDRIT